MRPVWRNQLGGITFDIGPGEVGAEPGHVFVKWAPLESNIDLDAEAWRLEWASAYTPVPRVVEQGSDDEGSWLVTVGLRGQSAVVPRWKQDPTSAVRAIGAGLRSFHDTVPVAACPFSWSLTERLTEVRARVASPTTDWSSLRGDVYEGDQVDLPGFLRDALEVLADPPPLARTVVCHGDACAPNTLIDDDGVWTAHVDLGTLGIADPWADLAIATWSCDWNYGPGFQRELLDAYGIEPDPVRTRYYRLLWELGP